MGQSALNLMTSILVKGESQAINVCCHSLVRDHELPTSAEARNNVYDIGKMGEYLYYLMVDPIKK